MNTSFPKLDKLIEPIKKVLEPKPIDTNTPAKPEAPKPQQQPEQPKQQQQG